MALDGPELEASSLEAWNFEISCFETLHIEHHGWHVQTRVLPGSAAWYSASDPLCRFGPQRSIKLS
jgi:hypothetical protein